MSPRTRFILLTILLVICILTAVAVVVTWAPPKPLHFRVTKCEVVSNPGQPTQMWKVSMVAENTSLAPVHLLETEFRMHRLGHFRKLSSAGEPKSIIGALLFAPEIWPASSPSVLVSPGESIECVRFITRQDDASKWLPGVDISYAWISYTASKAEGLLRRVRNSTPDQWRSHLPTRLFRRETMPLEPPPGMQFAPKP